MQWCIDNLEDFTDCEVEWRQPSPRTDSHQSKSFSLAPLRPSPPQDNLAFLISFFYNNRKILIRIDFFQSNPNILIYKQYYIIFWKHFCLKRTCCIRFVINFALFVLLLERIIKLKDMNNIICVFVRGFLMIF